MILRREGLRVCLLAALAACASTSLAARAQRKVSVPDPGLPAPIAVSIEGADPGALSASSPLSEAFALHHLDQLIRLKEAGLRVDYDLLDAYAVAPDGLHPFGRSSAWPDGANAWIARCRAAGIRPGLRFTNSALRPDGQAPDFFEAEILHEIIPVLQSWYDRGIRLFAFDRVGLTTATPETQAGLQQDEILTRNRETFRAAVTAFRAKNRGAVVLVIEGDSDRSVASAKSPPGNSAPVNNSDPRDDASRFGGFLVRSTSPPRASTMPQTSLQRAIDIETDGQIRHDEEFGVSLAHIFSCGFIGAPTSAAGLNVSDLPSPNRGWKSAFLLSMARGGWVNALSGSFDSFQAADVRWMARVQKLFFAMQAKGQMHSFGGLPASGQPYGFAGATSRGAVYVVINPSEAVATLPLPMLVGDQPPGPGRILFRDAGYSPWIQGNNITLGPGQMAAVGFGAYAAPEFNLGVQQDVVIPSSIEPVDADFETTAPGVLEAHFDPPIRGVLRIVVLQREPEGGTQTEAGAVDSSNRFTVEITQAGRPIPLRPGGLESNADGGLGAQPPWTFVEVDVNDLTPGIALRVRIRSHGDPQATLEGSAYQVIY